jgi:hypothetical protein
VGMPQASLKKVSIFYFLFFDFYFSSSFIKNKIASEIQTLEIADGNVAPKLPLMIFMIWPRLYTCPTVHSPNFKIEFEMNINVVLENDARTVLTHTVPILLVRS